MADLEHDFQPVIWQTGRWRGHPSKERLCTKCKLWETQISRSEPCAGAATDA